MVRAMPPRTMIVETIKRGVMFSMRKIAPPLTASSSPVYAIVRAGFTVDANLFMSEPAGADADIPGVQSPGRQGWPDGPCITDSR